MIDMSGTGLAYTDLVVDEVRAGARITTAEGTVVLRGVEAADVAPGWFDFAGAKGPVEDDEGGDDKFDVPDPPEDRTRLGTASIEAQDILGLDEMRADPRFSGYDGSGYTVVVLDTGIDLDHPAFGPDADGDGISDRIVHVQDFTGEGDGTADDVNGHGTNVTSIIASSASGYPGIAPGANIVHLQVLDNGGSGSARGIEAGLQWVVDNAEAYNVVAVNLSIQDGQNENRTGTHPVYGDEFAALAQAGVVTTVAAGNNYFNYQRPGHSTIATDPNVIPVGAVYEGNFGTLNWGGGGKDNTTDADRVTVFSQRSVDLKTVYAPGALILGAAPGGGTGEQGGTSQAAPQVAGMAVLAQEIAEDLLGRRLAADEFHDLLIETADTIFDGDDEDDNVPNLEAEIPRVNMYALAQRIAELGGGGPVEDRDDYAGDTSTAGRLAVGGSERGVIETPSDSDWFAIRLVAGDTYRLTVEGAGGNRALADPFATLHDESGAVLARNDDADGTRDSAIPFTPAETGTYYLAASGYGDETGSYRVSASRVERQVSDDFPADPTTTSTVRADGPPADGTIEAPGDRDWHRIEVAAGVDYAVEVRGNGLADPFMEIFDETGALLGSNDDGGGGTDARLTIEAKAAATLFVSASAADGTATGDYRVVFATLDSGGDDIPDDPSTTARATLGTPFAGELEPAGDRDWIAVTLSGGAVYDIQLTGRGGRNALEDPFLRVYDATGAQVAFNDDFGGGRDSRIEAFSPDARGTYFLSAGSYADEGTGLYELLVTEVSDDTDTDIPANPGTTSTVGVGAPVASTIDFEGDRDWHAADLEAGRSYRIDLVGSGRNALSDPLLRLYDGEGALLGENDDNGTSRDSRLVVTATEDARYFVSAGAYADDGTGRYTIEITDLGIDDDYAGDNTTDGRIEGTGRARGEIEFDGDTDWIAYFVEAGGQYRFDLSSRGPAGEALGDPRLTLRDAFGNEVAFDDDSGGGNDARIVFNANATGPIYLEVAGGGAGDTGRWELSAEVLTSGGDDHPDGFGGNALLTPDAPLAGILEQAGDADVFRFETTAGRDYTVDVRGAPTGDGTLADSVLAVYDGFGNLLTWNDDGPDGTLNSSVTFTAGAGGDHYAAVFGFDDAEAGSYVIALDERGGGGGGGDDFGANPAGAGIFDPFGFAYGSLEEAGDRDWIAVSLQAGFAYAFNLYGAPSGFGTLDDPFLRLYAPDAATVVAENDDNLVSTESSIYYVAPVSGVYYAEAGAFADAGTGDWVMSGFFA